MRNWAEVYNRRNAKAQAEGYASYYQKRRHKSAAKRSAAARLAYLNALLVEDSYAPNSAPI